MAAVVLAACSMDNPAYDLREGSSGTGDDGTFGGVDGDDDGDVGDGQDGADGVDVDGGSNVTCSSDATRGFNFAGVGLEFCGGVFDATCTLARANGILELQGCASATAVDDSIQLSLGPFEPPVEAQGSVHRVRVGWSPMGAGCKVEFAEIFQDGELPVFAGATVANPAMESVTPALSEPTGEARCACAEMGCCADVPGSYRIKFSSPAFGGQFGPDLGEGEIFDSQIGGLGHPIVQVFMASRDSDCDASLTVDWAMAQK